MSKPRRIALINQKGGVGKTTTAANLGAALARAGKRVLLLDLDPQGHLTMHLGLDPGAARPSVYEVLADGAPLAEAIHPSAVEGVAVVPSTIDLAAAEVELVGVVGREVILRDAMAACPQVGDYDYLLIDCPPSLGLLTLNALGSADEVFICLQPHFLALQGVGKLLETVMLVRQRINPSLTVAGVALCMYDSATKLAGEVTDDLAAFLGQHRGSESPWANASIFRTKIRRNIKLAECPSFGQSIFQYAPDSNGAADYAALADEVMATVNQQDRAGNGAADAPSPTAAEIPTINHIAQDHVPDAEQEAGEHAPAV